MTEKITEDSHAGTAGTNEKMRLFLAFRFSKAQCDRLLAARDRIAEQYDLSGRLIAEAQLHMTIAFCGELSPAQKACIEQILMKTPLPEFVLRPQALDLFGDALVLRFKPDEALSGYVRTVCEALQKNGIPLRTGKYVPHVTLIRKAVIAGEPVRRSQKAASAARLQPAAQAFLRDLGREEFSLFEACLYRSYLQKDGPRYEVLQTKQAGS